MASETELFKDKVEIHLDGRQVFYLFFGGAVIASLVFVLGVMVGKRVESRSHLERSAATSAALDPLAALDQLAGGGSGQPMSYASSLTGGGDTPAAVDRTISELEKARNAPAAKSVAKPESEDRDQRERAKAEAEAEAKKTKKAEVEKVARKAKEQAAKDQAAKEGSEKGRFTLQLSSFQDRAEATAFLARMKDAGYSAAVMSEAEVAGKGTYFRIRVGQFASYDVAVEAKAKFESEQRIIAYVTRL